MSSNLKKKNCQTLKRKIVLKSKSRRRSRWPRWCSATCRSRRSWPWRGWCRPAGPSQAGRREFSCQAASCQGERGGSCREARETGPSGAQLSGEGSGAVAWWAAARLWTECRPCQWGHCRVDTVDQPVMNRRAYYNRLQNAEICLERFNIFLPIQTSDQKLILEPNWSKGLSL